MKKLICAITASVILLACAAPAAASAISAHVENTESIVAKAAAVHRGKKKTGVRVTCYCACQQCNGCWSSWRSGAWSTATASGKRLYNKKSYKYKYCAATPAVGKLGQTVSIYFDGKWRKLKIVDRLGNNSGKKIDVFWPGHKGCYSHGVIRSKTVYVR